MSEPSYVNPLTDDQLVKKETDRLERAISRKRMKFNWCFAISLVAHLFLANNLIKKKVLSTNLEKKISDEQEEWKRKLKEEQERLASLQVLILPFAYLISLLCFRSLTF